MLFYLVILLAILVCVGEEEMVPMILYSSAFFKYIQNIGIIMLGENFGACQISDMRLATNCFLFFELLSYLVTHSCQRAWLSLAPQANPKPLT